MSDRHIPAVAYGVVINGALAVSGASGVIDLESKNEATTKSVFRIASMSKSFTAMAILKLRDEGKLSLEDYAEDYIPEMKELRYLTNDAQPIRIKNLLTMTAGFPEDNPWGDRQLDEPDQMLLDLMKSGAAFSNIPAYGYEYSNTGYALLGKIISNVTGLPYQEYITEHIFLPLGMSNTYWDYEKVPQDLLVKGYRWEDEQWKSEPILGDGSFGAMGGILTTIEDFAKYVNYHLQAYPARSEIDKGPVRRSTLREMHTPQYVRLNTSSTDYNDEPCANLLGYGYGLRITERCDGSIQVGHGGALPGYGSNYVFYPQYDLGIMAFGNLTYTGPYPLKQLEKLIFNNLNLDRRILPVSVILETRGKEVADLIFSWDPSIEQKIVAENFYLDFSKERRQKEISEVLEKIGEVNEITPLNPQNQLRGTFDIVGSAGTARVFFTLTPEAEPKVQRLNVWLIN